MKKLIVLDRDGVINEDRDDYVRSLEQWQPIQGSISAIARLSRAGWIVCVATNQSGVGRGYFSADELMAMHQKLRDLVHAESGQISEIVWCPHTPDEACSCRKPQPGLLDKISALHGSLAGCPMVGDTLRDLQAGQSHGMTPLLVLTGKGRTTRDKLLSEDQLTGIQVFDDLAAVSEYLLNLNN
ncbi:MAG: D-glycero-beta-D-manno-heptose 1,7-bisphosphate 7-phosphatase [Pseudomonadales bacterium]|nr:D-glycero-beta-D-manno-heptose 1,7-bisphosphate 7-phosphatase [Pseudomonadales bacterium]